MALYDAVAPKETALIAVLGVPGLIRTLYKIQVDLVDFKAQYDEFVAFGSPGPPEVSYNAANLVYTSADITDLFDCITDISAIASWSPTYDSLLSLNT